MPLCDDVVPPVNVDSLSLRLKFGKRNGTAASWLCNVINSIIFLCHMLYYCACWDAAALSLITFLLPVAFDFASLVCMYLAPHHPPWVTVPTFCIAELHGFFLNVSCVRCLIPLLTPPYRRCQRSTPTHTADSVTDEYQSSFECRTVVLIQQRAWVCSLVFLDNRSKRETAPLCGQNKTLLLC